MLKPGYRYSEVDRMVQLTMTDDDYDNLLLLMGAAAGSSARTGDNPQVRKIFGLVNRLNDGNPNFKPYEVREPAK